MLFKKGQRVTARGYEGVFMEYGNDPYPYAKVKLDKKLKGKQIYWLPSHEVKPIEKKEDANVINTKVKIKTY